MIFNKNNKEGTAIFWISLHELLNYNLKKLTIPYEILEYSCQKKKDLHLQKRGEKIKILLRKDLKKKKKQKKRKSKHINSII